MNKAWIAIAILIGLPILAGAQEVPAAKIFSLQGSATIERNGSSTAATEQMPLNPGDAVVVGEPGRVALELPDGSYIRLSGGSRMKFPEAKKEVALLSGALHFFSHSEQDPTVVTEHVTAAIRGTEFTLSTDSKGTRIAMLSGAVQGTSAFGAASLGAGQGATFMRGKAPEVYALMQSDRSVQWSAFIPVLGAIDEDTEMTRRALSMAADGNAANALLQLPPASSPCTINDLTRARILLSSGSVAEGSSLLERCSSRSATIQLAAHARSILALVRLTQGDSANAEQLSNTAMRDLSSNAQVRFARSIVLQDRGDLDGALAAVEGSDSKDPTLLARKAEVLFMFGRVPEARAILEALPTRSWYADAVLGFVLMGDREFSGAEQAFERAAQAEPAAGLPQLGLGLIQVNKGNLEAGRSHFEKATVLEPSRSTYRSYLAKSYFEADNYNPAEPEYDRAMELDKNDPTPHLYRSFMRLAQNRPVDALHDLEEARDLSDKRDVYRSKFLLDEDSAVQSASLSRVYRDLGFEQRGRIEAISAIYSDYENASAHRLLGETQDLIFNASSSLSERRISDLFAPLSINVADSIGTSVSLNEYSSLFERDGWRTGISSGYSSHDDTFVNGIVSANKTGNLVTALTATGVDGDGFIDDPRTNEGRLGISLQGQPTWADRFLVEARGVFRDDNQSDESNQADVGVAAGSYLHRFSPDTTLIAQTSYRRGRDKLVNPSFPYDVLLKDTSGEILDTISADTFNNQSNYETATENEMQLIDKRGAVTSVLTGRYSHYDTDLSSRALVTSDSINGALADRGVYLRSQGNTGLDAGSVSYLATVNATDTLMLNAGGEYSSVQFTAKDEAPFGDESDRNSKISPKGGIVFKPRSSIMLRTGYGEYLGRATREGLTSIEPTLVGGITQRYTDVLPGTQAKTWGTGIDLQPFNQTYIGSEWTKRWLDEPRTESFYELVVDPATGQATLGDTATPRFNVPIHQDFVSTYLYQVVSRQLVLGSDYKYSLQSTGSPDDSALRDHTVKNFARYFFTNMFFAQGGTNYRYQERTNTIAAGSGTSSGWTFDALLGYRLPTRHGAITAGVRNILGQDFDLLADPYFNEPIFNDPTVELAARFNF
jgi:tetratricopeptide (TPR) repeat protein